MYKESKYCCTADGFLVLKGFCKLIEAQATANIRRDLEKLLIPWSGQWIGLRLIQPSQNFEKSFLYSFEIGKNKFFPYRAQSPHKCEAAARRGDYLECSQVRGSSSAV